MTYAGYADIKITNLNSTDLTDYQVKIELNSTNFSNWDALRDDGIDIYFTLSDGTTEIPFWREYPPCNVIFVMISQKRVKGGSQRWSVYEQ